MKSEIIDCRSAIRPHVPDVLNIHHEHLTEATLRNGVLFSGRLCEREIPIEVLTEVMTRLQKAYDKRLTLAIVDRRLPTESAILLERAAGVLGEYRDKIARQFDAAKAEIASGDLFTQTASRLLYLLSLPDTPNLLDQHRLTSSLQESTFMVSPETGGVLNEALALLPFAGNVVGFGVSLDNPETTVSLFVKGPDGLKQIKTIIGEKEQTALAKERLRKKILVAVEGDIAGHAIRALETARGLRRLGYEPAIVGSGYYAKTFLDEHFNCLPPFGVEPTHERERIITQARGEGKGIFFWGFNDVWQRVTGCKESLRSFVSSGVDLFLCDMNPIADIAVSQLQKETGKFFPKLTETHNILLSPTRSLRTLKISGIPVGEMLYRINRSPIMQFLDPKGLRFAATHFLFNEVADLVMGLPLAFCDHLHGGREPRVKFTDYMYGRNGTLQFCFSPRNSNRQVYPIGLQADKGKADGSDRQFWEKEIPQDKPLVLNSQGSTYHKKIWLAVEAALIKTASCFSIHTTGVRENVSVALFAKDSNSAGELSGYRVGYAPGYRLARVADVVINHGGFGTVSQWLLATSERVRRERDQLGYLVRTGQQSNIPGFLNNCRGISRSLALCNTFEQENNVLALNEVGGDRVCTVCTADNVLRTRDPEEQIRKTVGQLLTAPVDNTERSFWLDLITYESAMNAPAHAALILERIILTQKKT
jgi:hypothetical protein